MVPDDNQKLLIMKKTIGRYEIVAPIGAGGMGSVYIGRLVGPAGFERLAAIKIIHPHLAKQPAFINMFMDEARLAARIHHPNVVEIFEFGEDSGIYYMVGELVLGQDLHAVAERALVLEHKIPHDFWAGIIADIARGLHEAHELRDENDEPFHLVHRDISTRNVIVSYKGYAKLIDFGIASARGRPAETDDGSRKGRIGYMAPEQLCGHKATRRSDIYALGVVLYTVVTGRHPFPFENEGEQVVKMMKGEFLAPRSIDPEIDGKLERIILRAMAKRPEDRFETADEMCRAVQTFVDGKRCGDMTKLRAHTMASLFEAEIRAYRESINTHRRLGKPEAARNPLVQTMGISLPERGATRKMATPRQSENECDLETSESFAEIPRRSLRSLGLSVLVIIGIVALTAIGLRYLNNSSFSSDDASFSNDSPKIHDDAALSVSSRIETPRSLSEKNSSAAKSRGTLPAPHKIWAHAAGMHPYPVGHIQGTRRFFAAMLISRQAPRYVDFEIKPPAQTDLPSADEQPPPPLLKSGRDNHKKTPKKKRRERAERASVEGDKPKSIHLKGWEQNPFQ